MSLFNYNAFDKSGAKIDGKIEATSKEQALSELKKQNLIASKLEEIDTSSNISLFSNNKIKLEDIEFLTAELSLLLRSGVRIDRGIDIIRKTKAKPALAKLLSGMSQDLKSGKTLSDAVKEHSDIFDPLYCNLVELGEASGNLSEVFNGLANDLKFKRDLQSKITGSLTYPAVIFFVCILSVFSIFNFIIPKMSTMFEGVKDLPWYTSFILDTSEWMISYQWFLVFGIVVLILGIKEGLKKPKFNEWLQTFSLKLPVVSTAVKTVERIRFNSGLAMMIKAGIPIDRALNLSLGSIKNLLLQREIAIAMKKVRRGSALTPALQQTSIYPPFYISLLEVGEESGNLESVFDEIAKRSRQDFEAWATKMTTLIEPLMILIMGGIVGGVVVTMLLSMVAVNDIAI
jgi:type II secretory pathway component PulF